MSVIPGTRLGRYDITARDSEAYSETVRDRSAYRVRKTTLADEGRDPYLERLSPSARVAMVWQLTLQAWAFKEPGFREQRLRRDVVRTLRGGR